MHARSVAAAAFDGVTGELFQTKLTAAGIRCEVVAPSKLQRPSRDRVKSRAYQLFFDATSSSILRICLRTSLIAVRGAILMARLIILESAPT